MSNVQQADKVGLKVTVNNETKEYQFLNEDGAINQTALIEYELYLLSTTVSRKKKLAKTTIANAGAGVFPLNQYCTQICAHGYLLYITY